MPNTSGPDGDVVEAHRENIHRVDARPEELEIDMTSTSDSNFFVGFKGDIARGGLFIATYLDLKVGEVLAVSLSLPGIALPQRLNCEVSWVREQNALSNVPPGAGVRFIDLAPETKALIQRFITHRPAMFYES